MKFPYQKGYRRIGEMIVAVMVGVVVFPLLAVAVVFWVCANAYYTLRWHFRYGIHGRRWLAYYSESMKWKDHFESTVIPLLGSSAYVVNISASPAWKNPRSFERRAHRFWAGRYDHTPIVIAPAGFFRRSATFRFHEAYLKYAIHGDRASLDDLVTRLRHRRL